MKMPSTKALILSFIAVFVFVTAAFSAYHVSRAKCPALKEFFDSSGLDPNAITAYFTGLAFLGFVVTSLYQARSNTAAESRQARLQHDSAWMTVQIARIHAFAELKDHDNLRKALQELEDHWRQMSTWMTKT